MWSGSSLYGCLGQPASEGGSEADMKTRLCKRGCGARVKGTAWTLHEKWLSEKDDPLHFIRKDGTQIIHYPDGTEENLSEDDPRYDHWHNK
jgi:hypothetical protein